ncbi:MAG: transposase family protein [Gammaproteobacteria bacterium]
MSWITTKEAASLLGVNQRTVQLRARREGWRSRPRIGRGGGREYHTDDLPLPTSQPDDRKESLKQTTEQSFSLRNIESGLRDVQGLSTSQQQRLNARLTIVRTWQQYHRNSGLKQVASQYKFAEQYNAGEIDIDAETRAAYPTISRASLVRWKTELKKHGVARLAGQYGNRKGQSLIASQPEVADYLRACLGGPHADITARHLYRGLRARFHARDDIRMPSPRSVERWLDAWRRDNAELHASLSNPDRWKNEYMVAHGSLSESISAPNQLWELDATPADVMLADGRHSLSGAIDVGTRRFKLLVTPTPRAAAVAALMRWTLLHWGVPDTCKLDNGKEYVGHYTMRILHALEITPDVCPPFQPWMKPHIERAFRTFSHDLIELLPNYIGHNVADRKAIEARRSFADRLMKKNEVVEINMTAAELQAFCDRWCESIYEHQAHDGLHGKTPFQVASEWTGELRRIRDERTLDMLLAEAPDNHGKRTVHKKGIRIKWPQQSHHHWYIAPELALHVRRQVTVLYDPAGDMGRVYVFGDDGFLCIAECPELTGIDRRDYAMAAKRLQRETVQARRREMKKAAKDLDVGNIAGEILEHAEREHGNVTLFPRAGQAHESAFLTEAGEAIRAADDHDTPAQGAPVSEESHQRVAAMLAEEDEQPMETPEQRFTKALSLLDGTLQGTPADYEWLAMYQTSSEFRGRYLTWRTLGAGADRDDIDGDPWLRPVHQQTG